MGKAAGVLLMVIGAIVITILIVMTVSANSQPISNYNQASIDFINNTGRCLIVLGPGLVILGLIVFANGRGSKKTVSSSPPKPVTPSLPLLTSYSSLADLLASSVAEPPKGTQEKPAISEPWQHRWSYNVTIDLAVLGLSLNQFCEQYYGRLRRFVGGYPGASSGIDLAIDLRGSSLRGIATIDKIDVEAAFSEMFNTVTFKITPGRTYWPKDPRLTPHLTWISIQKRLEERAYELCYPLARRLYETLRSPK